MPANDDFDGLFDGVAPVEPNALTREGAASLFELYTGLVNAGFNPVQAIQLVIAFIAKG
jgi:ABC-type iron transport system FetAB permease component